MHSSQKLLLYSSLLAVVPMACQAGEITGLDDVASQTIVDEVIGVRLSVPGSWVVQRDPALFETYGFMLYDPAGEAEVEAEGHDEGAIARVALVQDQSADDLELLVAEKMDEYADINPQRREVTLANGITGIAITGLPGTQPYSIVYAEDGDRVYEIGIWSADGDIDERAENILSNIQFETPTQTIESLNLPSAEVALYGELEGEMAIASKRAADERTALFEEAAAADPALLLAATEEVTEAPVAEGTDGSLAATCGFTAPRSLYWQLQWDGTNRFYSGSHYNLKSRPGWSAMSGNGGSWWGTNYHIWRCARIYNNQWFANDWPAQRGANAYAAFSGYVEWAGWGTDGYRTLGRYVVVRNGKYRSLTAHLTSIARGVTWGRWINGYSKVIGYAGDTGGPWAPHLHARVSWGERLTRNGQPYGGHSVRPRRLRCFTCTNHDVNAAGAGGFYTRFRHGRWMKY